MSYLLNNLNVFTSLHRNPVSIHSAPHSLGHGQDGPLGRLHIVLVRHLCQRECSFRVRKIGPGVGKHCPIPYLPIMTYERAYPRERSPGFIQSMINHTKIHITLPHGLIQTKIFSTLRSYVQYANPRFTLLFSALLPVDRASWVPLGMVTLPEDALRWASVKYTRSA